MPSNNPVSQLSRFLKKNNGFESEFGHVNIKTSNILGQGGNGIVYLGEINGVELAIKFLFNYTSNKLNRFRVEYLNVNIVRDKLVNVANCIHYGIEVIEGQEFPYIIMRKYRKSLKEYIKDVDKTDWNNVRNLFISLCESLYSFEQCEIIHRDLKPENILINEKSNAVPITFQDDLNCLQINGRRKPRGINIMIFAKCVIIPPEIELKGIRLN